MPKYKTHLTSGALLFLGIYLLLKNTTIFNKHAFLYFSAILFGSLFPDIDTKSMIQKFLYMGLFITTAIIILLKKWEIAAILGFISLIPIIANHRQLTHRIWFVIILPFFIPLLIFHFNKNLLYPAFFSYLFFVSGAILHIWLDFGFWSMFRRK